MIKKRVKEKVEKLISTFICGGVKKQIDGFVRYTSYNFFSISDEEGNVVVVFDKGNVATKNFNSSETSKCINDSSQQAFNISDPQGNVVVQFKNGHIRTQKFNSETQGGNQWNNKVWYAYGTSLTAKQTQYPERGVYADYVANALGLNLSNKGSGGSGATSYSDEVVYSRLMDLNDGKANADLITWEFGANDRLCPIGNIDDHADNNTFCGTLNVILKQLQENTHARIIVMSSWSLRYFPGTQELWTPWTDVGSSDHHTWYQQCKAIQSVCEANGVIYIPLSEECGMSEQARMNSNNNFILDQIHPTPLGAYNVAQYIISKLKNIPLWNTSL